jgi:hypothetical protein
MPGQVSHDVNRKTAQVACFQWDEFFQLSHFAGFVPVRLGWRFECRTARLPAPAYLIVRRSAELVSPWTWVKGACAVKQKNEKPHAHKTSKGHPEGQNRKHTKTETQDRAIQPSRKAKPKAHQGPKRRIQQFDPFTVDAVE